MSGPPFKSPHNRIPRYRQILIKKKKREREKGEINAETAWQKRERERDGALDEKNDAERTEEFWSEIEQWVTEKGKESDYMSEISGK